MPEEARTINAAIDETLIADRFRRWGHLQANLDNFGRLQPLPFPELDELTGASADKWRKIYCSEIGVEFMHIPELERRERFAEMMEADPASLGDFNHRFILERSLSAEVFENFLHTRYIGAKRFSLEGTCAVIPLLDAILDRAGDLGFEMVLIGMSHRGRLNTMLHILGSTASNIIANFEDVDPRSVLGSGDVKYHKGATGFYTTQSGKVVNVRLASNPSHLEAVNPVVQGRVRARQTRIGDEARKKVLPILLHGDAAFAGQGIVAETLNLAGIEGFDVGGTVHIVVNNLIGFTAEPREIYATRYSTDIAKRLPIPILHVNAEAPARVVTSGRIAMNYRSEFNSDVVIDLIGYRRYGHSEVDDPTLTSPVLYEKIKNHPRLHEVYAKEIGVSDEELKALEEKVTEDLKQQLETGQAMTKQPEYFTLPDYWNDYVGGPYQEEFEVETAISTQRIEELANSITTFPETITPHAKLRRGYDQRREMGLGKKPIDWGMAEQLAFASLLWDGVPVRLTGQDSQRGTFNHRQACVRDIVTGQAYFPLKNLHEKQGFFEVYNSILSEAAVLGFEYGMSRDYPEALVCWEAQFGDFANGAQIIIDQFITAAEDKWGLLSGLVILLPHGFEGQGPEHSSARLERFLQVCGEDNIQVVQPSTSAQIFHLLRRQALRKWRKPLVVMSPKSMLRAPGAACPRELLSSGKFYNVHGDTEPRPNAERILICSGKIVHELRQEREKQGDSRTAIITLEQLYPFPKKELSEKLNEYPNAKSIVWVQDEPANMGALFFVRPYIEQVSGPRKVASVKRSASASPATGSHGAHELEQQALLKLAFPKYN